MKNSTALFIGLLAGAFGMAMLLTILNTHEYGRMSNHKFCNMSLKQLGTVDESSRAYYIELVKERNATEEL